MRLFRIRKSSKQAPSNVPDSQAPQSLLRRILATHFPPREVENVPLYSTSSASDYRTCVVPLSLPTATNATTQHIERQIQETQPIPARIEDAENQSTLYVEVDMYPGVNMGLGRGWNGRSISEEFKIDSSGRGKVTEMMYELINSGGNNQNLIREVCKCASADEIQAKAAARVLNNGFGSHVPFAQASAARLWAFMLEKAAKIFAVQTASEDFLNTVGVIISADITLPAVRTLLLNAVETAARLYWWEPGTEGFRAIWEEHMPQWRPDALLGLEGDTIQGTSGMDAAGTGGAAVVDVKPRPVEHVATPWEKLAEKEWHYPYLQDSLVFSKPTSINYGDAPLHGPSRISINGTWRSSMNDSAPREQRDELDHNSEEFMKIYPPQIDIPESNLAAFTLQESEQSFADSMKNARSLTSSFSWSASPASLHPPTSTVYNHAQVQSPEVLNPIDRGPPRYSQAEPDGAADSAAANDMASPPVLVDIESAKQSPSKGGDSMEVGWELNHDLKQLMMIHLPPDLTERVTIPNERNRAHGGLADVYTGLLGEEKVAVKVLRVRKSKRSDADFEASNERRIKREMHVWAALKHQNICEFLGYSTAFSDYPALISVWCHGGTMSEHLEQVLSTQERITLTQDVGAGLQYLHRLKVIHGDLKPSNILVDSNGVAKLCDFGLVRLSDWEGPAGMTTTSPYTGTERYKAPELFITSENRHPVATFEGDIYSLGSILLEFIEKIYPFQRFRKTQDLRDAIMDRNTPALRTESTYPLRNYTEYFWNLLEACWDCGTGIR